ncbi:sigma-70 family RNA polymerase sigma factor [Nocardiopsis flavescens]|uniref:sigma-70 family RNA polymerase sigma factor n=1 Tax=Nocardiopsis flavescens TaxID=758803 RepID=UPI00366738D6
MAVVVEQTTDQDFARLAAPYRRELYAHCYRMLGSVHDAEDLVQETYLRAWKAYDGFEGRSSLRTWLHRIATTACLTALERRRRRPLPTGLGGPAADPSADLADGSEVPWLEPVPDALVGADDPGSVVAARAGVRLALVAALQYLQPRQRAVLVLRDVLRLSAAEVADILDTSVPAVNSLLQRARAQLSRNAPVEEEIVEPADAKAVLARYVAAFETYDVSAITAVFTEDAVFEMPPFRTWVCGAPHIAELISVHCPASAAGDMVLRPVEANGQPAFGLYMRDAGGVHRAFGLQVLDLVPEGVRHAAMFFDTSLFARFGLPDRL